MDRVRHVVLLLFAALMSAGCTVPSAVAVTAEALPSTRVAVTPPSVTTSTSTTGTASALLATLPVKGRAPKTGYTRAKFGDAWTDDVTVDGGHNGCDTRNDVLRRDLVSVVIRTNTRGCVVGSGVLHDPYTGHTITFIRGTSTSDQVQIDHVVALSNAWQTGAQALTDDERQNLANDPLELLAVDGPTNQSKGDGDAATWLPPSKPDRCAYVARQVAVKARYRLWVTPAERTAITAVLAGCPGQGLPDSTDVPRL